MWIALDGQIQDAQLVHRQPGNDTGKRTLDPSATVATDLAAHLDVRHGIEDGRVVACGKEKEYRA